MAEDCRPLDTVVVDELLFEVEGAPAAPSHP